MIKAKKTNVPGLYHRGESSWTLRARVTKPDGLRTEQEKTVHGLSKTEAIAALAEFRSELEQAVRAAPGSTPTLRSYGPLWLQSLAQRNKNTKKAFFATRIHYLSRLIMPYFGHMEVKEIRPKHIIAWQAWLGQQTQAKEYKGTRYRTRKNPKADKHYAHATLSTVWATFKTLFTFACIEEDTANCMHGMRFNLVMAEEPKKPKATLTADELARFIKAAREVEVTPDLQAMMVLGFSSTMRFCELSALEWPDIDLDKGCLQIVRSQTGGVVGKTKTAKTARLVMLPPDVVDELRRHKAWQLANGRSWGQVVFPSTRQTYRFPAILTKPMKRAAEAAGVDKHLTSHVQRKTGNNLIRQAAGDIVARAASGHVTQEMTELYSEVTQAEMAKAKKAAFGDAFAFVPAQTGG